MPDYRSYDISALEPELQTRLGRVFLSQAVRQYIEATVNGQGEINIHDCLQRHAYDDRGLLPEHAIDTAASLYYVGDIVYVSTDVKGRTFVMLQSELMGS